MPNPLFGSRVLVAPTGPCESRARACLPPVVIAAVRVRRWTAARPRRRHGLLAARSTRDTDAPAARAGIPPGAAFREEPFQRRRRAARLLFRPSRPGAARQWRARQQGLVNRCSRFSPSGGNCAGDQGSLAGGGPRRGKETRSRYTISCSRSFSLARAIVPCVRPGERV